MKYNVSYSENPVEYRRLHSKSQRARDPVRYLFNQAKYRAKQRGLEFTIKLEELEIPDTCPIMGIPLYFTEGRRGPNSFSIDRVDNTKGYVPGNVRIISFLANSRKGDLTLDQAERLVKYMKSEI